MTAEHDGCCLGEGKFLASVALPDNASKSLIRQRSIAHTQYVCRHQTWRDLCYLQGSVEVCYLQAMHDAFA